MMRLSIFIVLCASISGCAGFTAYVQQHAATIGAVGMVAGAISASEGAVVNAISLKEKLESDK